MINISHLKTKLTRLCEGTYSRGDVDYIVDIIHRECEKYILNHLYTLRASTSPEGYSKAISEHAYDFIGPLLGREPTGRFHILNDYFSEYRDADDEAYETAFYKFIYTHFHSELIREIETADGFSKSFQRTLYYLMKKHPDWVKAEGNSRGAILKLANQDHPEATVEEIRRAYIGVGDNIFSKYIEEGLTNLLETSERQVNLRELRQYLKNIMSSEEQSAPASFTPDPALELTKTQLLDETVQEIDLTILQKYVRTQKLGESERLAFQKSIQLMLSELSEYANTRNHADYLSLFLPYEITVQDYRDKYRPQFEYAAREARNLFSAKLKKMIIN